MSIRKVLLGLLKFVAFLAIGVGILWFISKDLDLDDLWKRIRGADHSWIIWSMGIAILSHLFRAARWNLLIEMIGKRPKLAHTFHAVMVGYLANLAIPRLGEVTRCGVLAKTKGIPMQALLGTILVERGFDMVCLLLLIGGVILLQLDVVGEYVMYNVFEPLATGFMSEWQGLALVGVIVLLSIFIVIVLMRRLIKKASQGSNPRFYKIKRLIVGFTAGMKSIGRMKRKMSFLTYTFLIWACYFMMVYLCFFSLTGTYELGVMEGITVLALGSLGIVAPIPGGVGTYHGVVTVVLMEIYAVAKESAVSYAYLVHGSQTLIIILVGILSYIILFLVPQRHAHGSS